MRRITKRIIATVIAMLMVVEPLQTPVAVYADDDTVYFAGLLKK